jgi:hypothetical protein
LWIDTQSNQQIFSVHYFIDTANHYSNKIIQEYYYSHFPVTFTSVQSFADAQSDFLVYPNPTTGEFTVYSLQSSVGCEIKVTNLVGETISKKTLNSKQETINLSGARGIYFLQIKTPYGTAMKKIVKE